MKINPTAIAFWICGTCIGYLCFGMTGAIAGLAITSGISVAYDCISAHDLLGNALKFRRPDDR